MTETDNFLERDFLCEFQICFEDVLHLEFYNTVKTHFHVGKFSTEAKDEISHSTAFAKFFIGKNGAKIKEKF